MDLILIVYGVIVVLMIICSSFFSMSETAFTSSSMVVLKKMAKGGDIKAKRALVVVQDYDQFLISVLVGNNVVNIAGTTVATLFFAILLGEENGALISTVFMTLTVLTFGEILPKSYAKMNPEKLAMRFAKFYLWMESLVWPFSWWFMKLTEKVNKNSTKDAMSEEELHYLLDDIESSGNIEKTEKELLNAALNFDDVPITEVMTPRDEIVYMNANDSIDRIPQFFADTGFSRILVCGGSLDDVQGIVYAKEYYILKQKNISFTIKNILRPAGILPESMMIATAFDTMQKSRCHMSVIMSDDGRVVGLVTEEDLVEFLVGDIVDETEVA